MKVEPIKMSNEIELCTFPHAVPPATPIKKGDLVSVLVKQELFISLILISNNNTYFLVNYN